MDASGTWQHHRAIPEASHIGLVRLSRRRVVKGRCAIPFDVQAARSRASCHYGETPADDVCVFKVGVDRTAGALLASLTVLILVPHGLFDCLEKLKTD